MSILNHEVEASPLEKKSAMCTFVIGLGEHSQKKGSDWLVWEGKSHQRGISQKSVGQRELARLLAAINFAARVYGQKKRLLLA